MTAVAVAVVGVAWALALVYVARLVVLDRRSQQLATLVTELGELRDKVNKALLQGAFQKARGG